MKKPNIELPCIQSGHLHAKAAGDPVFLSPAAALTHRSFFWTIIFWIAAKKAGISLSMLLKKELLLPLGIRKMAWVTCP